MTPIQRTAVIGTGMMGPGIAAIIALRRLSRYMIGERPDWAEQGVDRARRVMEQLLAVELTTRERVERGIHNIQGTADLDAGVAGVQLVVEGVYEKLELKTAVVPKAG